VNAGALVTLLGRGRAPGPPVPPIGPWVEPRGAFCIPGALPGSPYGDGRRIWDPAFGCYELWYQQEIIKQHVKRNHNVLLYQISGFPYHNDYPELDVDPARTVRDLTLLREANIQPIVIFDDRRFPDLSYLAPVAAATQDLVCGVMGIMEVNGVVRDVNLWMQMMQQQKALWPGATHGVHLMDVMGGESYGFFKPEGWAQAIGLGLDLFFFQAAAWLHSTGDVAARAADYTRRLGGPGMNGYPTLPKGVVQTECYTSLTYREQMTEAQSISLNDQIRAAVPGKPDGRYVSVPMTGYMDGGTA